ncbi:MAG: phospho-sugar mutase, partial [Spirochaetaceae bacterium]|nr:phospho-sugar mutase [Spirochaetaceae bacterium]
MTNEDIRKAAELYLSEEENDDFRIEVKELLEAENWEDLSDRFWRDLDFGTGGLRGVIGGGINRINPTVVRRATQGMANYIISHVSESERGVAIAYDSRHYSKLFAEEAARVMAQNGIRTWLFSALRPVPVLSYAVRYKSACAGIMITASHNPAAYNGYKVYWSDGAQVVPPHDNGIIAEVRKVSGSVPALSFNDAVKKGFITMVDQEIDLSYKAMVVGQSLNPELVKEHGSGLKIVYSPLHGTGLIPVETVLEDLGIKVITVPEQREPDGDFPTVDFPNPEIAPALELGLKLAAEVNANLLMATDPDADRLGIAVPDKGKWELITGNQLGALLSDYIFRTSKEQGLLPANPAFVNTIVTSEFQNKIAEAYGATSFRVLTGFKFIGEKIRQFESDNSHNYVFGGEESYGYLVGTSVRDKDAVSAAAMTAEMALWNQSRGMTVMDHLRELWTRFGFWQEMLISRYFEGQKGEAIMSALMKSLRDNPPESIALKTITAMRDYRDGTTKNLQDGSIVND